MPRKLGCVVAIQRFMAHVKSLEDKVEFKHSMQKGSCAICVVHSDRGGEFTTTFGFTRSTFDELLLGMKHEFSTPDRRAPRWSSARGGLCPRKREFS
jgi:hypothetical protein